MGEVHLQSFTQYTLSNFQEKSGLKCVQFVPCKHIYCRNCIKEYFEVRINDGSVTSMPCPDIKCKSEATQQQIRELVGPTKFNRYDSLLLSAALSTMSDITYCPRLDCQSPVVRESDEKLATCPACNYAFCVFCRMSYHGVEMCRIKNDLKKALINEYNSGDSEVRERLERRYGKRQLVNLVNAAMSEEWISTNSKLCPCCSSPIEKSDGCNKIVCWKCHNYFCWLCSRVLDPSAPYKHFYDPMSKCYNLLFEGVKEALGLDNEEDEEDDDDEDDDDVDEEEDDDED
ncbi:hypothetical protein AAG570_006640 [Ranatra chinensis]|uniref:RBR-type E3 ubiquitin transferase n=1 Tax=Ranatra chinensis TaxID=642074 RepID=A0ABD0Z565_9HEMI